MTICVNKLKYILSNMSQTMFINKYEANYIEKVSLNFKMTLLKQIINGTTNDCFIMISLN